MGTIWRLKSANVVDVTTRVIIDVNSLVSGRNYDIFNLDYRVVISTQKTQPSQYRVDLLTSLSPVHRNPSLANTGSAF